MRVGSGRTLTAQELVGEDPSAWWGVDPAVRPVGLETEFGVIEPGNVYANPVSLASEIVAAYGCVSRDGDPVRWDYEAEDPLADLRGGHLDRAAAHPSMLTDDPDHLAPSGEASGQEEGEEPPPAPWGTRPRPSAAEAALPRATTAVLPNGARLYVDHAHPEYSSPEVLTPHDAVAWDRAGEVVARRAIQARLAGSAHGPGREIVLYKNNVDGKGAAYGAHENYLLARDVPFEWVQDALVVFLMSRQVLVGAGRVGIGERSQQPGFQVSQRADYIGCEVGLQTTFNRPIVNTRDEPHAEASRWRRLHVINADANLLDTPVYLRVATTNLLLWWLERAARYRCRPAVLDQWALVGDPVEAYWATSHDVSLRYRIPLAGGAMTALELQRALWREVSEAVAADGLDDAQRAPYAAQALALWDEVLGLLEDYAGAWGTPDQARAAAAAGRDVEWLARLTVCEGLRSRYGCQWDDPRLAALDIQWADVRSGHGVAQRLVAAGRTRRLVTDAEVERAVSTPPLGTRALVRGRAVGHMGEVVAASWTSLVLDVPGAARLWRVDLPADVVCSVAQAEELLERVRRSAVTVA